MTIRAVKDTPCWTLDHESEWDWRPHEPLIGLDDAGGLSQEVAG